MSGQHKLPDLPYPYEALEPFISKQIMEIHHKKHHQTYVNALNAAETAYGKAASAKERIGLQQALKFNGGGHINHSLFWKNLAPAASEGKGVGGKAKGAFCYHENEMEQNAEVYRTFQMARF